jgi:hypothetical protein
VFGKLFWSQRNLFAVPRQVRGGGERGYRGMVRGEGEEGRVPGEGRGEGEGILIKLFFSVVTALAENISPLSLGIIRLQALKILRR